MRRLGVTGKILILAVNISVILSVVLYVWRSKTTFRLGGNVDTAPLYIFFNPFRNRGPESAVDRWLQPGISGNWGAIRGTTKDYPQWSAQICGEPTRNLISWKLQDRRDQTGETFLSYRLQCSGNVPDHLLLVTVREREGNWNVIHFKPDGAWDELLR
jgi:hypothetical protein